MPYYSPEIVPARKAIFKKKKKKNGQVYTSETSCMEGTSVSVKNMGIKQLCNGNVRDFGLALLARKVSLAFEKRVTGP